jgi:hypothetical protein
MVLETLRLLQGMLPISAFSLSSELEGVDSLTCAMGTLDLFDFHSGDNRNTEEGMPPHVQSLDAIVLPWDTWDARLVIGSMIKTIVDLIGDMRLRVREQAVYVVVQLSLQNSVVCQIVLRYLFKPTHGLQCAERENLSKKVACLGNRRAFMARIQICTLILKNLSRFSSSQSKDGKERKGHKDGGKYDFPLPALLETLAPFVYSGSADTPTQRSVQSCVREIEKAFSNEQVLQAILGSSQQIQKSFEELAQRLVMRQVEDTGGGGGVGSMRSSKSRRNRSTRHDDASADIASPRRTSQTSSKPPRRSRRRDREWGEENASDGISQPDRTQPGSGRHNMSRAQVARQENEVMSASLDTRSSRHDAQAEDPTGSASSIGVRGLLSHRRESASSPRNGGKADMMSRSFGGQSLRDGH